MSCVTGTPLIRAYTLRPPQPRRLPALRVSSGRRLRFVLMIYTFARTHCSAPLIHDAYGAGSFCPLRPLGRVGRLSQARLQQTLGTLGNIVKNKTVPGPATTTTATDLVFGGTIYARPSPFLVAACFYELGFTTSSLNSSAFKACSFLIESIFIYSFSLVFYHRLSALQTCFFTDFLTYSNASDGAYSFPQSYAVFKLVLVLKPRCERTFFTRN